MKKANQLKLLTFFLAFILSYNLSAQVLTKTEPEKVGMSSERLEILTDNFQQYTDNSKLPGGVVLIARRGQIAYFNSFGKSDIEKNTPMEENSIFRIASQTKAIVSVGIMMLQE